jgi:prepilin-type N-terminal cleavage/methylation domain-containing protein
VTKRDDGLDRAGTRFAAERGHTLVELLVALAIVGILAGIGWGTIQPEVDRFRMMRAARMLQSDLQTLRALAISTSRETRLLLIAADDDLDPADVQVGAWLLQVGDRSQNSVEWDTLPIDDGSDSSEGERILSDGGADEVPRISLARWPTLVGPGTANADAIVFSPRGWIANPPADFADGYVTLRIVNKRAMLRGATEEAHIRISRGGLTRLEVSDASALPDNSVGVGEASAP